MVHSSNGSQGYSTLANDLKWSHFHSDILNAPNEEASLSELASTKNKLSIFRYKHSLYLCLCMAYVLGAIRLSTPHSLTG